MGEYGVAPGPAKPQFTELKYPELEDKVVIVTGGNTGVGYETVKSLAATTKARIYIFSRNKEKTLDAIKQVQLEIAKECNVVDREINFVQVDLSDLKSIKPAVEQFLKTRYSHPQCWYHGSSSGFTVKQGHELQRGTNVLGPHLLQRLLDPLLIETSNINLTGIGRIVWIASTAHIMSPEGGVFWENIGFQNLKMSKGMKLALYGQSKAANILQARTWSCKHNRPNVISSSICPGFLNTGLQKNVGAVEKLLMRFLYHPWRYGAYTGLNAALPPDVKDGSHAISFGVPGHIRQDLIPEGVGDRLWTYLDKESEPNI
ncbi:hypothetical protein Cantr_06624 [Candida viswanathii]|uniref:Oxidoreductase n=1 Tax=Candida viswanathii TaxID=5486 RepID=A0A367XXM2_9ASCO|nr:hypothetical protein Cantr_06624 [Candida viswanathii]